MTTGTVGARLGAMFDDPKFRCPDTESGRTELLADLNRKVQRVRSRLPRYFGVLPKADVVVKRVPGYMEAARTRGYYQPPSLDARRPGAYYINLRSMAELPSWTLANSAYHQSVPGNHLRDSHGTNACNAESPIHLYGSRNTFLDAPVPSHGARSSDRDDAIGGTYAQEYFTCLCPTADFRLRQ
jgi:uncharacterized protein (DUF885 family)